jgi:hypothetical protein
VWLIRGSGFPFKISIKAGSDIDDLRVLIRDNFKHQLHHSYIKLTGHDGAILRSDMKIEESNTCDEAFRIDLNNT